MVLNGFDTKFQLELSFNGASSSVMKILKMFPNDGFLCFRGIYIFIYNVCSLKRNTLW